MTRSASTSFVLPAKSLTRLREVGCPRRLADLASLEDWHCSCLCFELIPSVAERSALFVKELSFPQTEPTDDAFFNRNRAGACWNRWAGTGTVAGPIRWLWTLDSSAKIRKKEDRRGLICCRSDAKSVLSCGGEYQLLRE